MAKYKDERGNGTAYKNQCGHGDGCADGHGNDGSSGYGFGSISSHGDKYARGHGRGRTGGYEEGHGYGSLMENTID